MGGLSGDRCGDDRRHVGGAVADERRPRARPRAARARTARPDTPTRASSRRACRAACGRRSPRSARRRSRPATPRRGSASAARARERTARPCGSRSGSRPSRTRRRWCTRRSRDPAAVRSSCPSCENVQVGESHRLAVLEMNRRPGVWRVWVDGKPATDPVVLPGSHRIWKPIATAESWNGGVADVQRLRLPLRAGRRRGGARRLVAHVPARVHVPGPRLRRAAAPPRTRRPADALVRPDPAVRVRRGVRLRRLSAG